MYNKKVLGFCFLLFLCFSFITPFVIAQVTGSGGGGSSVASSVLSAGQQLLTDWGLGKVSDMVAKGLLFFLVFLLIYGISDKIPGLGVMKGEGRGKGFLRFAVSFIVAFLGVAYITPDEVSAILISYTGLGFVLAGFLPILILGAFTWSLLTTDRGETENFFNLIIATLMWVGFAVFAFWKGIWANVDGWFWTYTAISIFAVVVAIYLPRIGKRIKDSIHKARMARYKRRAEDVNLVEQQRALAVKEADE